MAACTPAQCQGGLLLAVTCDPSPATRFACNASYMHVLAQSVLVSALALGHQLTRVKYLALVIKPAAAGRPRLLLRPAALAQQTLYLGECRHRHTTLDTGNVLLLSGQHKTTCRLAAHRHQACG
jgi:hypothetical protein